MSDAVSSATAACFDVSRFVSHVCVAHLSRGKIGTVSQTSGAIRRGPCSSEPVREAARVSCVNVRRGYAYPDGSRRLESNRHGARDRLARPTVISLTKHDPHVAELPSVTRQC